MDLGYFEIQAETDDHEAMLTAVTDMCGKLKLKSPCIEEIPTGGYRVIVPNPVPWALGREIADYLGVKIGGQNWWPEYPSGWKVDVYEISREAAVNITGEIKSQLPENPHMSVTPKSLKEKGTMVIRGSEGHAEHELNTLLYDLERRGYRYGNVRAVYPPGYGQPKKS